MTLGQVKSKASLEALINQFKLNKNILSKMIIMTTKDPKQIIQLLVDFTSIFKINKKIFIRTLIKLKSNHIKNKVLKVEINHFLLHKVVSNKRKIQLCSISSRKSLKKFPRKKVAFIQEMLTLSFQTVSFKFLNSNNMESISKIISLWIQISI